jgi:tRNA threonylcarbamoyladenosine modification (KEOPS) complex Cgi121 subunit
MITSKTSGLHLYQLSKTGRKAITKRNLTGRYKNCKVVELKNYYIHHIFLLAIWTLKKKSRYRKCRQYLKME